MKFFTKEIDELAAKLFANTFTFSDLEKDCKDPVLEKRRLRCWLHAGAFYRQVNKIIGSVEENKDA